jgi:heme/copper-type cytochrome/quinol oxidase subunit 2
MKKYLIAGIVVGVITFCGWYFSKEDTPNLPMPTPPTNTQTQKVITPTTIPAIKYFFIKI